jgi:large subunit ribosomal protein L5
MYEFVDINYITVSLPRVRDFKGVSTKAFDGRGNYTLGLKEQLIFPEIEYIKLTVAWHGDWFVTTPKPMRSVGNF